MLNVDKVYTAKWMPLDNVRDYVMGIVSDLGPSVTALTSAQKEAIYAALNTDKAGDYVPTSPFSEFQANNGVVIPDMASCIDIVTSYYRAALGEDIDTTSATHVGRMIEQSAIVLRSAIGFCAANIMQTDLTCATGRYLDALASMFFAERKSAVPTKVIAVLSNTTSSPVSVLASSSSCKDADGISYNLSSDITVPAASGDIPGTSNVTLVCETAGAVVPNEGSLDWTLPTGIVPPASFSSVTIGYDVESDDDFRTRLKSTRVSSVGFLSSVKSALLGISGVYDALVVENTANSTVTIQGIPLAPHSIVAYVDYDGTGDTENSIAQSIFNAKAVGCGYTTGLSSSYGTEVTATVQDPSFNTPYSVTFYKPKLKRIYVDVTVSRHEYTGADLEADVKDAIVAWANGDVPYVDGVKIGQSIKAYEIGAAISVRIPSIQIDEVLVGISSAARTQTKITVNAYEIAAIAAGDIAVHIV